MSGNLQSLHYGAAIKEHNDELGAKSTESASSALRMIVSGTITYVGKAKVGSATSSSVWQVKKIDETTGMAITWADGNSNFDNVWDNYASLTYV